MRGQYWLQYFDFWQFAPSYSLWNDWRLISASSFISRHGLSYHINEQTKITGGYALALQTVPGSGSESLNRIEHRPWAQLALELLLKRGFSVSNRLRYEAQFRQAIRDGQPQAAYVFNHRLRFLLGLRWPIAFLRISDETPNLVLGEEIFLNYGPSIVLNVLDQTRTTMALAYRSGKLALQLGYMYIFAVTGGPAAYEHSHTAVLTITHSWGAVPVAESRDIFSEQER